MTDTEQTYSGLQRGAGWMFACYPVPGGWQWSTSVAGVGGDLGQAKTKAEAEAAANRSLSALRARCRS